MIRTIAAALLILLAGRTGVASEPGPKAQEVLAALAAAVEQGDAEAIRERVRQMHRIESRPEMVPILAKGLEHEDSDVRRAAALGLMGLGEHAVTVVPALADRLQDQDRRVRHVATWALIKVGPKARAALPALRQARQVEEEDHTRRLMDLALGIIAPEDVETAVVAEELAYETLFDNSNAAQSALRRLGPKGIEQLALLVSRGTPPHGPLAEGDDGREYYVRALAVVGPPARSQLPILTAALDDPSAEVRVAAAQAVWSLDGPVEKPIAVLVDLLQHEDEDIRRQAALNLGLIGPRAEAAVPALFDAARDESFAPIAARALAMITPRAVELVPQMVAAMRRRDDNAEDARITLELIGRPVVPVLADLLRSEFRSDRSDAVRLLAKLGPDAAEAVPALAQALDDDPLNFGVSRNAVNVLADIGPEAAPAIPN